MCTSSTNTEYITDLQYAQDQYVAAIDHVTYSE